MLRRLLRQIRRERELRRRVRKLEGAVNALAVLMQDTRGGVVHLVNGANAQQDTINIILQELKNEQTAEIQEKLKNTFAMSDLTDTAKRKNWIH